jgi:3-hydroxyisobutyrate dehydrogenase
VARPVRGEAERLNTRVGFIGLGDMGGALARRIAAAGFPLTIWARRAETIESFADTPACVAASPAAVAERSDIVGLCVFDDTGIDDVMDGDDGVLAGARPGTVIAIHSTVHPDTCGRWADVASARDVTVIDAPVSGGRAVAEQGALLVMTGGDGAAAERARPVFETFGSLVLHMGPIGAAQRTKLVNNTLLTANMALAGDAIDLGEALGIDPASLARALQHGSARSFGLDVLVRMRGRPEPPAAGMALLRKDVELLTGAARQAGADAGALVELADRFLEGGRK